MSSTAADSDAAAAVLPATAFDLLHVHHVVRRAAGGTDALSNLVTLCALCHPQVERAHPPPIPGFKDRRAAGGPPPRNAEDAPNGKRAGPIAPGLRVDPPILVGVEVNRRAQLPGGGGE